MDNYSMWRRSVGASWTFAGLLLGLFLFCQSCSQQSSPSAATQTPRVVDVAAVRDKAAAGDAAAQAELGGLYAKGESVTNSYAEAAKWFRNKTKRDWVRTMSGRGRARFVELILRAARVAVVQAADLGNGADAATFRRLDIA